MSEPNTEILEADTPASSGEEAARPGTSIGDHHSIWGTLRYAHFRNVWFGAFGSSLGSWMEHVGVAWLLNVSGKERAPVLLGYLAAAQLGPTLFLGLPAGVLADRVNRKRLLVVTQFLMMLIAGALCALSAMHLATPSTMLWLMLAMGVTMAFNVPAWQVLTPRLVPRERLTSAIVLNGLQFNVARVIGPGLGGLLLGWKGPTILFAINTVSFVGVLAAIASTPDAPSPPRADERTAWDEAKEALHFIFAQRGPRAVFMALTVFGLLAAPLMRLLPQFVSEVYESREWPGGRQESTYGVMLAMMGAGAVLGVFILRLVPRWYPKHHMIPMSIFLSGICITLFGAASRLALGGVLLMLSGAFWLWSFNSAFAAMQLLVPDRMRGRAMAVTNVSVFGAMAIGPLLAGWLGAAVQGGLARGVGVQLGVGLPGVVMIIAAVIMLTWRTPEVDGLSPGDPGYDRTPSFFRGITGSVHRPGGSSDAGK